MELDKNPAARLYDLLEMARSQSNASNVLSVWCEVLGLAKGNSPGVFKGLSYLLELAEETERLVRKIPDLNHNHYLDGISKIKEGISYPNLNVPWDNAKQFFSEKSMAHLSFCAERLSKHFPEQAIPEDALREIGDAITKLFEKVASAPISHEFKELLLDLLERMRRGVSEYRIRGEKSLREALESSIGRLVLHSISPTKEAISTEEKDLFDKFKQLLWKLNTLINHAGKYKLIGDTFKAILDKYNV